MSKVSETFVGESVEEIESKISKWLNLFRGYTVCKKDIHHVKPDINGNAVVVYVVFSLSTSFEDIDELLVEDFHI